MKQNILKFGMIVAALLSFLSASAYDFEVDGIYYNITSESGVSVTYKYYEDPNIYCGEIIIPETVNYNNHTYLVKSIEWHAFYGSTYLTSINIPNSVTSIGNYAFMNCTALTSVTIPNSVTSIKDWTFSGCSSLKSVNIPNSVTHIGESAFRGDSNLKEFIIPAGVTTVGPDAFTGCSSIIKNAYPSHLSNPFPCGLSISYPDDCTVDSQDVIYDKNKFKVYYAPIALQDNYAIPGSVTEIGQYAFYGCSSLEAISISNSVTSIGQTVFQGCSSLKTITFGSGLEHISDNSFTDCSIVKAFWLGNTPPEGFENVNAKVNYVANNQYNLGNQIIYQFLSSKFDVDGVVYVPVSPSDRTCDVVDCLYNPANTNVVIYDKVSNQGIEMTVNEIRQYSFAANDDIQTLNLSNNGNIGDRAFSECGYLYAVTVSNNGNIGDWVFNECYNLETAAILNKGHIGHRAFAELSKLSSVTLGQNVTGISSYAFEDCSSILELIIPNSVSSLGEAAFEHCSALRTVTIGSGVPKLSSDVFYGCSFLSSITIPNNVQSIEDNAFGCCYSLADVTIEDADDETENDRLVLGCNGDRPMFADCPLDKVYIGRKLEYDTRSDAGYSPFYRNTSLRSVEITDAETQIYDNEFYGCSNLQSLKIGDGVTTIGRWAFSGCSSLDYFSAGSNVESIGEEAFSDCTGLTKYYSFSVAPPVCDYQALDDINKWNCTLYVPVNSRDEYKAAEQWKDFFFVEDMKPVTGICLNETEISISIDETFQLTAEILPSDASDKTVIWKSSNPDFATVDKTGLIKAISEGAVTVTAKSADGDFEASCAVSVIPSAGMEAIEVEDNDDIEVFNLSGVRVSNSINDLPGGLYIVKQGTKVSKVFIR